MPVNLPTNPYQRFTPFVAPEEFQDLNPFATQTPQQQVPEAQPDMFEQVDPQQQQPQADADGGAAPSWSDYQSPDAIERRHKLAQAIMGQQQEVHHPLQALGNVAAQLSGAYMEKKAQEAEQNNAKQRNAFIQNALKQSGGDMAKFSQILATSPDPDMVEQGLNYQVALMRQQGRDGKTDIIDVWGEDGRTRRKALVRTDTGEIIRYVGGAAPLYKPGSGGGGSTFDPTDDPDQLGGGGAPTGNEFAGGKDLIDPNSEANPTINGYKQAIGPDGKPKFDANYRPIVIGKDGKEYSTRFPSAKKYAGVKGALNDDDVTRRAMMVLAGDTQGAYQGISRANGGLQSAQIGQRVVEMGRAMGFNSREAGLQSSEARGSYQAMLTKRKVAARMVANSTAFISAAKGFGDQLGMLSRRWPRGQFVPLNQLRNLVARNLISSPDYNAFMAGLNSFVQAYAKAVSPQGAPTEGMRQHAYDLLNSSMSQESFDANMKTLYAEMTNESDRLRALDQVFGSDWLEQYGGGHMAGEDSDKALGGEYHGGTGGGTPLPRGRDGKVDQSRMQEGVEYDAGPNHPGKKLVMKGGKVYEVDY